VDCHAVLEL